MMIPLRVAILRLDWDKQLHIIWTFIWLRIFRQRRDHLFRDAHARSLPPEELRQRLFKIARQVKLFQPEI